MGAIFSLVPPVRFPPAVRLIVGIVFVLLGVGSWSCHVESPAGDTRAAAFDTPWVRTADGWERAGSWLPDTKTSPPRLHPLVVASGQLLLSLLALAAFSAGGSVVVSQLDFANGDRVTG
jgi:hypothetical protein